jgi:hypothetical protein
LKILDILPEEWRDMLSARELAASEEVPALAKHGEIGGGHNSSIADNISSAHGTSAAYLVAKLKCDA